MVTWLKDGDAVRAGPGLQQTRDGTRLTLTVERVRQVDRGTYRCQLTTADGATVDSATWTLRVHGKTRPPVCLPAFLSTVTPVRLPSGAFRSPVLVGALQDCSVSEGQTVSLQVGVEGKPAPDVRWLINGQFVPFNCYLVTMVTGVTVHMTNMASVLTSFRDEKHFIIL